MYSAQDERLDPLKRKTTSVYIVESDNDFFFCVCGCVIQAHKQFSQVFSVFFFFSVVTLGAEVPCDSIMQVCVCACVC